MQRVTAGTFGKEAAEPPQPSARTATGWGWGSLPTTCGPSTPAGSLPTVSRQSVGEFRCRYEERARFAGLVIGVPRWNPVALDCCYSEPHVFLAQT